jgi:hypothetical protein
VTTRPPEATATPPAATDPVAIVSVVYETEYALLRLQARSLRVYLPPETVREIIVIDNSVRPLPQQQRRELLREYGRLAGLVRILRPEEICRSRGLTGWRGQQVLKLCVADRVSCRRYLVLDAKNHFVSRFDLGFVTAPDGRATATMYGYGSHPLRPAFEHVLTYLGLDPTPHLDRFTATVTPFVLDRDLVQPMIRDLEHRSGRPFAQEFLANGLTEFILYSAWIIASGRDLAEVFAVHDVFCPVIWPRAATAEGCRDAIATAVVGRAPVFSAHRRALARLDTEATSLLAQFWTERGLFPTAEQAAGFVQRFQRDYPRQERRQRLRSLPGKLTRVTALQHRLTQLTRRTPPAA